MVNLDKKILKVELVLVKKSEILSGSSLSSWRIFRGPVIVFRVGYFWISPSTSVDDQNKELLLVKVDCFIFRITTKL